MYFCTAMRKYIAIFFLSVYLVAFTEARQILKMPNLVEHFIAHKVKDKRTTLYSFFKMHYLDAPVKDADYSQDMKLPFKTHDYSATVNLNFTVPLKYSVFNFIDNAHYKGIEHNFSYSEKFYPAIFIGIWQPPKV